MDVFILYLQMGWEHIVSPDATDHQLFLLCLLLPYRFADYRKVLWLVTAFTLGHSLTLALSAQGSISLSSYWIELFIPATILGTAVFQSPLVRKPNQEAYSPKVLYGSAAVFGLIHGLGFANTLRMMLGREVSLTGPLLSFNLGLEMGQIVVLLAILLVREALHRISPRSELIWPWLASGFSAAMAMWMMVERG